MKKTLIMSLLILLIIPIIIATGSTNPPKTVDYGDIISLDHIVYSDEKMLNIISVEYDFIINVSSTIEWHSGLIGLSEMDERAWLLNTPVNDCVHWVLIREIHEWNPVPEAEAEPLLDMIINGILDFVSTNLLGMIISSIVVIYFLSKILFM